MAPESPNSPPPRWLRTLPWMAGLLIGASAHVVFFARQGQCDAVKVVETKVIETAPAQAAPPTTVHVHVHETARSRARAAARTHPPRQKIIRSYPAEARGEVVCAEDRCTIRRSFVERLLDRPQTLGALPRLVPTMGEGDAAFLRVHGVRHGSVGNLLGLRNGDAIIAVDGQPIAPFDLMRLGRLLRERDELTVTLRRGDALRTMHYTIVDE